MKTQDTFLHSEGEIDIAKATKKELRQIINWLHNQQHKRYRKYANKRFALPDGVEPLR